MIIIWKTYIALSLLLASTTVHALPSQSRVEARRYRDPSAPPYAPPSISKDKPWPKVQRDRNDPNIYIVYSSSKDHKDHAAENLVSEFLHRTQIQNVLELEHKLDIIQSKNYPKLSIDGTDPHFSIVGPEICGGDRRQCNVLLNRKSPEVKWWIQDSSGKVIAEPAPE
ncbi:hypothetical protein J3R30DRAFT_134817 [Lentinula aciculospora]|uniref:Uncharacterized protein n=1 Tax=Lentinula aciculospora TaxID=153920 RepID=A0A9W9DY96_9AGAR|nr:hypothetical protein J3R30DRAFT_134817 [Lentinula aciculospora]